MTIADICQAWDRPSYVHGDVPSTHTVTRKFREGDRTPETVGHVLMKYQPYLQRYANRHFPKYLDEAELEDSGCAAPWVDVYGLAATLNEILSPKALDAFAPVLRAGMDLRAEARIQTPREFASAMHGCHRAHRRFGAVAKWATAAVVSVVIGLGAIMSARTWQRRKELRARHAALIEERARRLGRR